MNLRKPTPPGLPLSGEELSFPPKKGGLRGVGFEMLQRSGSALPCSHIRRVKLTLQKSTSNLEMELPNAATPSEQLAHGGISFAVNWNALGLKPKSRVASA